MLILFYISNVLQLNATSLNAKAVSETKIQSMHQWKKSFMLSFFFFFSICVMIASISFRLENLLFCESIIIHLRHYQSNIVSNIVIHTKLIRLVCTFLFSSSFRCMKSQIMRVEQKSTKKAKFESNCVDRKKNGRDSFGYQIKF